MIVYCDSSVLLKGIIDEACAIDTRTQIQPFVSMRRLHFKTVPSLKSRQSSSEMQQVSLSATYGPRTPSTLRPRSPSEQILFSRATVRCARPALSSECSSAQDLIAGGA